MGFDSNDGNRFITQGEVPYETEIVKIKNIEDVKNIKITEVPMIMSRIVFYRGDI